MMKRLFAFLVLPLLLSACIAQRVAAPDIIIPPGEAGGPPVNQPVTNVTKIVTMVTETPVMSAGAGQAITPPAPASQPGTIPGSKPADQYPQPAANGGVNPVSTPPGPPQGAAMPLPLTARGIKIATIHDKESGFAIDYPDGWVINDLTDQQKQDAAIYSITLRSGTPTVGPKQQEGYPEGITAIDVTVNKNGPKTLAQAINEQRASAANPESGQPVQIDSEEDWTLQGGLPAHRFLFRLGADPNGGPDRMASELVTMIQGRLILVYGTGDMSLWNAIAASLRAVEP